MIELSETSDGGPVPASLVEPALGVRKREKA